MSRRPPRRRNSVDPITADDGTNWLYVGVAVAASTAVLYGLSRELLKPTKKKRKKKRRKETPAKPKRPKGSYYTKSFVELPTFSLIKTDITGKNCAVECKQQNKDLGLKTGSEIYEINGKEANGLTLESTWKRIKKEKTPMEIVFRENPVLEKAWEQAEVHKEAANAAYSGKEVEKAIELYKKAIELAPTNKVYHSNAVLAYLKLGTEDSMDLALQECKLLRELAPQFAKGHHLRGIVLSNMKQWKHAQSAFQAVLKIDPTSQKAANRLKECEQQLEQAKAAKLAEEAAQKEAQVEEPKECLTTTEPSEEPAKEPEKPSEEPAKEPEKPSEEPEKPSEEPKMEPEPEKSPEDSSKPPEEAAVKESTKQETGVVAAAEAHAAGNEE